MLFDHDSALPLDSCFSLNPQAGQEQKMQTGVSQRWGERVAKLRKPLCYKHWISEAPASALLLRASFVQESTHLGPDTQPVRGSTGGKQDSCHSAPFPALG